MSGLPKRKFYPPLQTIQSPCNSSTSFWKTCQTSKIRNNTTKRPVNPCSCSSSWNTVIFPSFTLKSACLMVSYSSIYHLSFLLSPFFSSKHGLKWVAPCFSNLLESYRTVSCMNSSIVRWDTYWHHRHPKISLIS